MFGWGIALANGWDVKLKDKVVYMPVYYVIFLGVTGCRRKEIFIFEYTNMCGKCERFHISRTLVMSRKGVELVEGEGIGAEGDGAVGADAGGHDADALLGVVDDFVRGAENFDFPRVSTGEVGELGVVVEVVDTHLYPVELVAA